MMGIVLNVLWNSEEDMDLINKGVDVEVKIENAVLMEHTFYNIDFIRPYQECYCEVSSGGEIYIVNESYDQVKSKIHFHKMFAMN